MVRRDHSVVWAVSRRNAATSVREIRGSPGRRSSVASSSARALLAAVPLGEEVRVDEKSSPDPSPSADPHRRACLPTTSRAPQYISWAIRYALRLELPTPDDDIMTMLRVPLRAAVLDDCLGAVEDQVVGVLGLAEAQCADDGIGSRHRLGHRRGIGDLGRDDATTVAPNKSAGRYPSQVSP